MQKLPYIEKPDVFWVPAFMTVRDAPTGSALPEEPCRLALYADRIEVHSGWNPTDPRQTPPTLTLPTATTTCLRDNGRSMLALWTSGNVWLIVTFPAIMAYIACRTTLRDRCDVRCRRSDLGPWSREKRWLVGLAVFLVTLMVIALVVVLAVV